MASLSLPDLIAPAKITKEWLTAALQERFPGVVVATVQVTEFIGFKPNKVIVTVEYSQTANTIEPPKSFLLKGAFRDVEGKHAFSEMDLGLTMELASYAEVLPRIDATRPECFWVGMDEVSGVGAMLLEDLSPTGARFLKDEWSLDRAQAVAFVEAMGRFHANWMGEDGILADGPFGPGSGLRQRAQRLQDVYLSKITTDALWGKVSHLPRAAVVPRDLRDAERIRAAASRMHHIIGQGRSTIVHGDEHIGNLYIDNSGHPGFIDWCCRIAPWVIGYAYFVIVTLDPLDRRVWEKDLLKVYLNSLASSGVEPPAFEEAWYHYRCAALYPFMIWYVNSAKWQPETVNTRNTQRALLAMLDHETLKLLAA